MKCAKCNEELVSIKTKFRYLGHEVFEEVPRCPKCGQVYIDENLVNGKVRKLETTLEDK